MCNISSLGVLEVGYGMVEFSGRATSDPGELFARSGDNAHTTEFVHGT
jgi:hypothetical protein